MAQKLYNNTCEETATSLELGANDYVVIVTKANLLDLEALLFTIRKNPRYIGLIGNRRKRTLIYEKLVEEDVSRERHKEVYSPIGLPINAETHAELAVSIVAELIQVRAQTIK